MGAGSCSETGSRRKPSRAHRKAERVLPEPVGAMTRAFRPEDTASHAPSWAAVGASKAPVNQVRVCSVKRPRTASASGACPDEEGTGPPEEERPSS